MQINVFYAGFALFPGDGERNLLRAYVYAAFLWSLMDNNLWRIVFIERHPMLYSCRETVTMWSLGSCQMFCPD
jgi:hypothetical protein